MPRRLPTIALALGFAAAVFSREARAADATPDPGPAVPHPQVRVAPADGSPAVQGTLLVPALSLRTDIGTLTIDTNRIGRITFQRDPNGQSPDTVQLVNKEIVHGRIVQQDFPVREGEGPPRVWKKSDVREILVVHEQHLSLTAILIGLLTLAAMEIVLGVDNVIFLAIVTGKLPAEQQPKARRIGLGAALGTRLLLLLTLSFLLGLTTPIFTLPDLFFLHSAEAREVSWRDLILLAGGLFLIGKSVFEMHEKLEHAKAAGATGGAGAVPKATSFARAIVTIAVIDIVFSLDSVITAVGMVDQVWVMVVAMVLAMLVMLWFSGPIARFVDRHPTVKVLALAFLILIGVMLVVEGLGQHVDKGYIYFAMAFSMGIELVNMRLRKSAPKADLTEMPGTA